MTSRRTHSTWSGKMTVAAVCMCKCMCTEVREHWVLLCASCEPAQNYRNESIVSAHRFMDCAVNQITLLPADKQVASNYSPDTLASGWKGASYQFAGRPFPAVVFLGMAL